MTRKLTGLRGVLRVESHLTMKKIKARHPQPLRGLMHQHSIAHGAHDRGQRHRRHGTRLQLSRLLRPGGLRRAAAHQRRRRECIQRLRHGLGGNLTEPELPQDRRSTAPSP
ncbi:hypothetical protein ACH4YO_13100 [Streptomyces noursei]|uniref:hypothetical protein n=1 Tax=Streptomyces noursei TaxID=1971 RepID=UPI0033D32F36